MPVTVLITGGTGFIGSALTALLVSKGYHVAILSRTPRTNTRNIRYFHWNISKGEIDLTAFENVHTIIHLAGVSIAEGRWTAKRKQQISNSRIEGTKLLYRTLMEHQESLSIKTFIGATATGIYGSQTSDTVFKETSKSGSDFLAEVCVAWEAEIQKMKSLGMRTVLLRTGIVLGKNGGALHKMATPFRFGMGAALASGKQYMPWIHLNDLCKLYLFALENPSVSGVFNAVAGASTTNAQLSKQIAKQLNRPLFLPNIPNWFLKLIFGEMAVILTSGSRVSAQKVKEAGFDFEFEEIETALEDLL